MVIASARGNWVSAKNPVIMPPVPTSPRNRWLTGCLVVSPTPSSPFQIK